MQKVYKATVGWKEEDERHEATHVLMPISEYLNTLKTARHDEREKVQKECQETVNAAKDSYDRAIELKRAQMDQELLDERIELNRKWDARYAALEKERQELDRERLKWKKEAQKEKEDAAKLNEGLLRIMTERANAKRRISPKKEHDGYIVTKVTPIQYRWWLSYEDWKEETGRTNKKEYANDKHRSAPAWVTTIETPYDAGMDPEEVEKLVWQKRNQLFKQLGIRHKIAHEYKGTYPEDEVITVFDWKLESDYKHGFMKFVIWTNKRPVVSEELRDPRSYA